MESIPLLRDIVALMAVSVPISIILTRLGFPTVVGFLVTGAVIGPYGFGLVVELESVETLAQIGIVLLLFTIGLEFSLTRMLNIRREAISGGLMQVVITTVIAVVLAVMLGLTVTQAVLVGFIISLSSTAIVLKLLLDSGELNSAHGTLSLGILLFQDICVVLMVMVVRILGGDSGASAYELAKGIGLSLIAFGAIIAAVTYALPKIFDSVARLKSREVFILTIVLVCLGTAWLTSFFGLSLAIGAFIAGVAVSESEYSNQIVADVVPFRDIFSSLFFMSIGMLLDVRYFAYNLPLVLLLVAGIFVVKSAALVAVGQALKYPVRLSIAVGMALAQIGEFSFILIKMGKDYGLLTVGLYQSLLGASIFSMAITPFIFRRASRAAYDVWRALGKGGMKKDFKKVTASNHVIIIGYGLNGRNLAKVLKETAVPHIVVDANIMRVREAKSSGAHAYFGDASHPEILRKMGIESAKMVVVAISDPISTRRIVKEARELSGAATIIVRTRYTREMEDLGRLGASQVIPEEFETSVEIFARVLRDYRIPSNIIQNQIDLVRQEGYAMLRTPYTGAERLDKLTSIFEANLMDTFYVNPDCWATGKTLHEINLRKSTGASVIAILRKGVAKTNPHADFAVDAGDILVLLGSHEEMNSAMRFLKEKCPEGA